MRIKELLKEKGITQQELSDILGVSYQSIKQTLNAPSVTTSTLEKIATALNDDVKGEELTALIQHKGEFYKATTISELEKIVAEIKEK